MSANEKRPPVVEDREALKDHRAAAGSPIMARAMDSGAEIVRGRHESHFVIVPNATARDPRIGWLARGILVEILSYPTGWRISADRFVDQAREERGLKHGEGRRAVRTAFAELAAAGYLHRFKRRGPDNKWRTVLVVFDTPRHRGTGSGTSESGTSESGTSGTGTSYGKRSTKTEEEEQACKQPPPHEVGLATVGDCGARARVSESTDFADWLNFGIRPGAA